MLEEDAKPKKKTRLDNPGKANSVASSGTLSQTAVVSTNKTSRRRESVGRPTEPLDHYEFSYSKSVYDYVKTHSPTKRKKKSLLNPTPLGRNIPLFVPSVTLHHVHKIDLFAIPDEATFIWEPTGAPHWTYLPKLYAPSMGIDERKSRLSYSRNSKTSVSKLRATEKSVLGSTSLSTVSETAPVAENGRHDDTTRRLGCLSLPMLLVSPDGNSDEKEERQSSSSVPMPQKEPIWQSERARKGKILLNSTPRRITLGKKPKDVSFSLPPLQCAPVPEPGIPRFGTPVRDVDSSKPSNRRGGNVPKLPKIV